MLAFNKKVLLAWSSYVPTPWNHADIGSTPFQLKIAPVTQQLLLDDKPLYTFIGDKNPGDQKGDGMMGEGARVAACGGWCRKFYLPGD